MATDRAERGIPPLPWPYDTMSVKEIARHVHMDKLVIQALCALHRIPRRKIDRSLVLDRAGQAALYSALFLYRQKQALMRDQAGPQAAPQDGWIASCDFAAQLGIPTTLVEVLCTVGEIPRITGVNCNTKYLDPEAQKRFRKQLVAYRKAIGGAVAAKP